MQRPFGIDTLRTCKLGQVDIRIVDVLTDTAIRLRATTLARYGYLVGHIGQVGAIIGNDKQRRNPITRRGPQCTRRLHEIAVTQNADDPPFAATQSESYAEGIARPRAEPAARGRTA